MSEVLKSRKMVKIRWSAVGVFVITMITLLIFIGVVGDRTVPTEIDALNYVLSDSTVVQMVDPDIVGYTTSIRYGFDWSRNVHVIAYSTEAEQMYQIFAIVDTDGIDELHIYHPPYNTYYVQSDVIVQELGGLYF